MKNTKSTLCFWMQALMAVVFALLMSSEAFSAVITNEDVISLLGAGMPEEVVVQAISSGEPKFDISSSALIKLKEKGATPLILKTILGAETRQTTAIATAPTKSSASKGLNPEEVILRGNGKESTMQYIVPEMRNAARAFGFGGFASYAVLRGEKAQLRLTPIDLEFIVSVPQNAQPTNYLTLASLAARPNGTREVIVGGGYLSYSSGIHRDRVVPVSTERLEDQSQAGDGFIVYRVKPVQDLKVGEYALVLYTGEVRSVGYFAQSANSFFDFGID